MRKLAGHQQRAIVICGLLVCVLLPNHYFAFTIVVSRDSEDRSPCLVASIIIFYPGNKPEFFMLQRSEWVEMKVLYLIERLGVSI